MVCMITGSIAMPDSAEAIAMCMCKRSAGAARRQAMHRAFHYKELLVFAGRMVVGRLAVGDEIVPAHGHDQHRHADLLHRADGGIVAGAIVNIVHRIPGADGICAEEGFHGQQG